MRVEEGYLEPPGELTTGKKFNMTWVICNTGKLIWYFMTSSDATPIIGPDVWSQGIRLVYYSGYNFEGILEGPVGSLKPGERKIITVCVNAPSEPGIYGTHLRLCTEDGLFFGGKFIAFNNFISYKFIRYSTNCCKNCSIIWNGLSYRAVVCYDYKPHPHDHTH